MSADQDIVREMVTADSGTISMLNSSEINQQIATAHQYPRSIKAFLNQSRELVTLSEDVAGECIYALPRKDKTIEGPSARFAEIMAHTWGNSRAGARVIDERGDFVTAQGVFHDLEKNVAITYEVKRRIVDRDGNRYSADMIGVTANAACSIALRNAILKGVPKAFWSPIYEDARKVIMGDARTLANRRTTALYHLQKFGATEEMVLAKLGVAGVEEITIEHLVTLHGFATAIRDGDTTVEQAFAVDSGDTGGGRAADAVNDALRRLTSTGAEQKGQGDAQPADTEDAAAGAEKDEAAAAPDTPAPDTATGDAPPAGDDARRQYTTDELLELIKNAETADDLDFIRTANDDRDAKPQSKATVTKSLNAKAEKLGGGASE